MKKDLFYTSGHEWIEFRGTVAYAGICGSKLKGITNVQQIKIADTGGFRQQGELVATICFDNQEIPFRMPVHGRVIDFNETLMANHDLLLQQPEESGWIVFIIPSQPYERKNLLLPQQFRMNGKGKYDK